MIKDHVGRDNTVGSDKNFDTSRWLSQTWLHAVSHNASTRRSAIDARTTRHSGYRISAIKAKTDPFGWIEIAGGLRKTRIVVAVWLSGSSSWRRPKPFFERVPCKGVSYGDAPSAFCDANDVWTHRLINP